MVVLIILCAAAGFFWMSRHNQQANTPGGAYHAHSGNCCHGNPGAARTHRSNAGQPQRLLPAVDNAAWDTATPVEQTIDLEYLNTDSRMAALPALGTVERSHFDTVTFLGDSITEGMECYATGYQNAHVRAYRGAGPESVVYNTTVKDHIRNVQEPAFDAVVETQPDALYILFGTNTWSTAARTLPPSSSPIMKNDRHVPRKPAERTDLCAVHPRRSGMGQGFQARLAE